jgi:hypothetical protein
MITRIEALHYGCLRYVNCPLARFQILAGPNASGKSTFLDTLSFLGAVLEGGPGSAFRERSPNPLDLFWSRQPSLLELAIEARVPERLLDRQGDSGRECIRYEMSLELEEGTNEPLIRTERLAFKSPDQQASQQRIEFPAPAQPPEELEAPSREIGRTILKKVRGGNDNFSPEVANDLRKTWMPSYKLGPRRSTLANLPADETQFPVAHWLKQLLQQGVQRIVLNNLRLRQAAAPGTDRLFRPDGSNLPWVLLDLREKHAAQYAQWLAHVRGALPEIQDVRVVVRDDDKHACLAIDFGGGLQAPSWVVSPGVLRLLALTVLAYLPKCEGIRMIEEPENGIHPLALEAVFQSLSSAHPGQVLLASHSPVLLSIAKPADLLCFARTPDGATAIVRGDEHAALLDWQGQVPRGVFSAGGVLG